MENKKKNILFLHIFLSRDIVTNNKIIIFKITTDNRSNKILQYVQCGHKKHFANVYNPRDRIDNEDEMRFGKQVF